MPNPFGVYYSLQSVLLVLFAILYYKIAEAEDSPGVVWAGVSVGVYLVTWRLLGWGYPGNIFGQVALFGGITLWRVWNDRGAGQ